MDKIDQQIFKNLQMQNKMKMRVFIGSFYGVWLGGYAYVVAETKRKAYNKLKKLLKEQGFDEGFEMSDVYEIDTFKPNVGIIWNGDY